MRSQYIRSGNGFVLVYAVTSKYAGVSPLSHYFELITQHTQQRIFQFFAQLQGSDPTSEGFRYGIRWPAREDV